ncbi:MAG: hypothetical protein OXS29_19865 [bacterium]|nr:hypothetical protein [bacterium]MDE0288615.1 hypothetical protein [bacterium]MDE0439577.1 hypothetical protein [bacterium]
MRACRTLIDLVAEIEEGGGGRGSPRRTSGTGRTTGGPSAMEAHSLRGLRLSREVTQTELARRLGRAQSAVSIMESSEDHLMSTVRSVVEGLGGCIEVVAVFADESVPLVVPARPPRSSGDG